MLNIALTEDAFSSACNRKPEAVGVLHAAGNITTWPEAGAGKAIGKRRRWDSIPRTLAARRFSRPPISIGMTALLGGSCLGFSTLMSNFVVGLDPDRPALDHPRFLGDLAQSA
jgi:hypothetical protein